MNRTYADPAVQPTSDDHVQAILELQAEGRYPELRELCAELLEAEPEYRVIALQYLGLSFHQEENYREAVPFLRQAAEEGQQLQDYFNLLIASVYDRQRFLEEHTLGRIALKLRASAGASEPSEELIRFHYCRALDDMKRHADARRQLDLIAEQFVARGPAACARAASGLPSFAELACTAEDIFYNLGMGHDEWERWLATSLPESRF